MTNLERFWEESNADLVALIRDEILATGPIRFDRFMELVLYHPDHGYYRTPNSAAGRSGDFITAPEAHPIFGATLARQIVEFDDALDSPETFTIVEYGAGSGRLIRPLLAELRQQHGDLYHRLRYVPVEVNRNRIQDLVDHLEQGGHGSVVDLDIPEDRAVGCVIANEFIDAFPARRVGMSNTGLNEVVVNWREGWFHESIAPCDDPAVSAYLERHGLDLSEGDWLEFHPAIAHWASEVAATLSRGSILVIDYGYPAEELIEGHRRRGTLKGYYQHGVTEELYRGIGRQDLTAHVNFSELQWQLQQHGFEMTTLTNQAELLEKLGIGERLVKLQASETISAEEYLATRAAVLRMIDPGAMGRFRAMILTRS